uniref:Reverse transcriptase domain-containing protein n=1 Tax=Cannabis sativa TaxID=3483 RepID=A0A803QB76_CANSA
MDPAGISDLFEESIQLSQSDLTFSLNPGEVDEPQESNKVLLGKIINRHKLGKAAIQGSLKLSWNAIKGWKWKEIEGGLIQFTFARRDDAMNVLARRPWFICGALVVIMPWPAWLTPAEVRFDKTPLWVNVESIPPFYWNLSNLKELASKASPVHELPQGIEDAIGLSTLRFRATIDLNKPIYSGFFLRRQKLKDLWIQYRYEKLPKLCFKCGLLTHDQSTYFKVPTIVKDEFGNFYPMFGVWLKNDAQEKSTFTTPLAKWFQDWVLQKRLGTDPVLRNQMKIHRAIRNSEEAEIRIGEVAPFGNNSKRMVIQDLIDAAIEASDETSKSKAGLGKQGAASEQSKKTIRTNETGTDSTISLPSIDNEGNIALHSDNVPGVSTQPEEHTVPCAESRRKDKGKHIAVGNDSNFRQILPYKASPLGTQAQIINWPSKECWAQPKARELLMGALTVDKFHREPTLFNPILDIEDFRVQEHLNGPRKRKGSDGIIFNSPPKSKPNQKPFSQARRGRPRKSIPIPNSTSPSPKRRGRPPKVQEGLSPTPKSFKGKNNRRKKGELNTTITSLWEVRQLAALIRQFQPEMLLLSETRIPSNKFQRVCNKLKFDDHHYVPPVGLSGGLGLCWLKGVQCNILKATKYVIWGEITSDPPGEKWHLYATYGPPNGNNKEAFWNAIGDSIISSSLPTLLIGDLNGTLLDYECLNYAKQGNSSKYSFDLRRMVNRTGLVDLGFIGPIFTWSKNNRGLPVGGVMKKARLDRGLASTDWRLLFPSAILNHVTASVSDHRPILLDTYGGINCKGKMFKYENMWARDQRCFWVVKEAWAKRLHQNPMINFHRKVRNTSRKLQLWNKTQFKHLSRQVQEATSALAEAERLTPDNFEAIDESKKQLSEALLREEIHWKQKSRVQWLKEGDKCTKFFMTSTVVRRRRNYIQCIKGSEDGDWIRDQKAIAECFLDSFKDLFKKHQSQGPPTLNGVFQNRIDESLNEALNEIPNLEEVKMAIMEMGQDKAPGPDGLPPSFYNHHWDTIAPDFLEMINHFFCNIELPHCINDTSIVLIPKKDNPTFTKDYRPIALCKVAYKVISKILATRLRSVIQELISPNQAAFVKGRCIAENTMIAREIVHSFSKKKGKRGFMMIKLDLEKAYDKMDWDFILLVLTQLGFTHPFSSWIKECISVKGIKLLLNGTIAGKFTPGRGLRQGDPLSPTLFILAAETLSRLLINKEKEGKLKGFKLNRHGTSVSHLMFADDIILFGQATLKEAKTFMECLSLYCKKSGQSLNRQKSSIFFSKGVDRRKRQEISQFLEIKKMAPNATYLGLPLFQSQKRSEDFKPLQEKVLKRVQGWKSKLLSNAGRACLIKSVGSSLSNYLASSDALPKATANSIDRTLREFWWGDKEDRIVLHPIAWESLCKPKVHGGLGFRTTEATNKAFLIIWAWKILNDDYSLWKKIMIGKYLKQQQFLDMESKPSDSLLWKAILQTRPTLLRGLCKKIGDGKSTSIWFHPWVPGNILQPQPRFDATEGVSLVSHFILNNEWEDRVRSWFHPDDSKRILNITLPNNPIKDSWLWLPENNGKFSIKSAYRTIKNLNSESAICDIWRTIWGAKIHNRAKMLWWKIAADCLLSRGKLQSLFPIQDNRCPLCSLEVETSFHLFWECHFARAIWFGCLWNIRSSSIPNCGGWEDWIRWFKMGANRPPNVSNCTFMGGSATIFEAIWRERNDLVHNGKSTPVNQLIIHTNRRLLELMQHQDTTTVAPTIWLPPLKGGTCATLTLLWCDPLAGELYTLTWGAEQAVKLGLKNVIFQSDSKGAVEAINGALSKNSDMHFNITDLVNRFLDSAKKFELWEACWIPRTANGVAHAVAKWANRSSHVGEIEPSNFHSFLHVSTADGCSND